MVFFQWDPKKSESNFKKHGVLFEEAIEVFSDPRAIEFFDKTHSRSEDRFWIIGKSQDCRVLFVVYSVRRSNVEKEEYRRIISARSAKRKEQALYDQRSR